MRAAAGRLAPAGAVRRALRASIASRWATWLWRPIARGQLCILTLHRFGAEFDSGMQGIDLDLLDEMLSRLRYDRYNLWDLQSAIASLAAGEPLPPRSVAFTVDDGYADFARGAEIFRRYECPVTVFLVTGFIDGECWLWWDEIEYCCLNAPAGEYTVAGLTTPIRLEAGGSAPRIAVVERLWEHCKRIGERNKREFVRELPVSLGVVLPCRPPPRYAPLTWDAIRGLDECGIRFGPHTVRHPILSAVDDEQAAFEIEESWRRLRQEIARPTPILAYPNGHEGDFGEREFQLARRAGLMGAVTCVAGYANAELLRQEPGSFTLPRFGDPGDPVGACLTASGFTRLRQGWRS
jgi:peptidoglycan/xylan/chitin deacetylase (PgdA/CDA1 family)